MRIRCLKAVVLAMAMLCGLAEPPLHAGIGVRELPAAPQMQSSAGVDYTLRVTSLDGKLVTLIDVRAGVGGWDRVDATKLPAMPATASSESKDPPQWFYGDVVGWMAVPAGWHVQRAAVGIDGNSRYTFVAPEGASAGWLTYAVIPACEACLLEEAEGLLPDAGERIATRDNAPAIRLGQTNPVMSWQSRPDDCTALFRYRSGALTVRAAVLSSVPVASADSGKGDLSVADMYVALPDRKAPLGEALVDSFRQAFPACRSPRGWPG